MKKERFTRLVATIVMVVLLCLNIRTVGRIFSGMVDTVQTYMARWEMHDIQSELIAHYHATNRFPEPGEEFDDFVRQTFHRNRDRDTARDRFGHAYDFLILYDAHLHPHGFRLVSAGPDRRFRTADDIVVEWIDAAK